MSVLSDIASGTMLAQTVRMTLPYACAGLGGVLSERSGVVNIALEGILLSSALAAVATQHATGSAFAGAVAGVTTGALVGLVHATLVVRGRIDAIVSGLALNLLAAGGTRCILSALYGSSSNSPNLESVRPAEGSSAVAHALLNPFTLVTLASAAAITWMLARTRFGLRLRACGEDPSAAQAVGVDVARTRTVAVMLGGAICGLGGAAHALDLHQFQSGMTGGRGFIALAALIVAGWRPWPTMIVCLVFASLDAIQSVLQSQTHVLPPQVFATLPFIATLLALAVFGRRRHGAGRAPAGLGKHPI